MSDTSNKTPANNTEHPIYQRYRDPELTSLVTNQTIDILLSHHSVRKFQDLPITDDQISNMVAAASSASTSSNLQSWSVIAVRDPERKARLAEYSGYQEFVAQAPLFLVWVADYARANSIAKQTAKTELLQLDYLESVLMGAIDAALAAQNAAVAAESMGLGITYVGAIRNHIDQVIAELDLPEFSFPVVGMAVGYPDSSSEVGIKPRLPQSAVLHFEQYDSTAATAGIEEYDSRLAEYYTEQGKGSHWPKTVVNRLSRLDLMYGREHLRPLIEQQGFRLL